MNVKDITEQTKAIQARQNDRDKLLSGSFYDIGHSVGKHTLTQANNDCSILLALIDRILFDK